MCFDDMSSCTMLWTTLTKNFQNTYKSMYAYRVAGPWEEDTLTETLDKHPEPYVRLNSTRPRERRPALSIAESDASLSHPCA